MNRSLDSTQHWDEPGHDSDALGEAALEPELPPRYRLVGRLGRGGMAVVYRAVDQMLHRDVAVKVMDRLLTTNDARIRFLSEAQTTAQLSHPNIVPIHDVGTLRDGRFYAVMKLVEGATLGRLLAQHRDGPDPVARNRILHVLVDVAHTGASLAAQEKAVALLSVPQSCAALLRTLAREFWPH